MTIRELPVGGEIIAKLERVLGAEARKDFEVIPAISDALKDEVYRIRHKVYCEELAYEPWRPDLREHDEYDAHSLHLLIRSVRIGEFMGCTRLIRPRPEDPHSPLPFERTCAATLDRSIIDPAKLPRDTIGEVSRLAVLSRFRKQKGEATHEAGIVQNPDAPTRLGYPFLLAGLYLGIFEHASLNGIDTLFVLTEERMARHLRILGVKLRAIGGPIEYRGQRLPSMINDFHSPVRRESGPPVVCLKALPIHVECAEAITNSQAEMMARVQAGQQAITEKWARAAAGSVGIRPLAGTKD